MKQILAITSDPIDCVRGYSLVFQKIVNNIDFAQPTLILNRDGESNKLITERNCSFILFDIKAKSHLLKGLNFIFRGFKEIPKIKWDFLLANGELPEMILTLVYSKIYGIKNGVLVHDLYSRKYSFKIKIINAARIFLVNRFDKILTVNRVTLDKINSKKGYFIGNLICDNNGKTI